MAVGYAYSILGDFHLAEDAAQEAFLDAYRHLGDLRGPLAFPGWLRRIVFKHCDRRTRKRSPRMVSFDEVSETRSSAPSPEDIAERNEMTDRLTYALHQIPEKQRAVLVLHYMSGHSLAELSAFLNAPVGTIKKRLYDGREKLREILTDELADRLRSRRPSRDSRFAWASSRSCTRRGREIPRGSGPCFFPIRASDTAGTLMGNTALILAAANGHRELAALLREASGPVDLHEAAAIGDTERLLSILDETPGLVDSFSGEGFTALALAAHFGHADAIRLLLDRGAGVNVVSKHPIEVTPLIAALFGHRLEAAKILIERSADVSARRGGKGFPRAGWSALHYAAAYGFLEIVSLLLARGASMDCARRIGGDGSRRRFRGRRPAPHEKGILTMVSKEEFLTAVTKEDPGRVKDSRRRVALPRRGEKRERRLRASSRPLSPKARDRGVSARPQGNARASRRLRGRGLRKDRSARSHPRREAGLVDSYAPDGFFPLGLAAFFGREAAVRLLLARGANVDLAAKNALKVAAIHASAEGGLEIARLLIEAGANVNAVQQAGLTLLHAAAMTGQLEFAKLLLARGADREAKAADGRNALAMAQGCEAATARRPPLLTSSVLISCSQTPPVEFRRSTHVPLARLLGFSRAPRRAPVQAQALAHRPEHERKGGGHGDQRRRLRRGVVRPPGTPDALPEHSPGVERFQPAGDLLDHRVASVPRARARGVSGGRPGNELPSLSQGPLALRSQRRDPGDRKIRRELLFSVDPELFPHINGTTDSEVMFYLMLSFGLDRDPLGAAEKMAGFVEAAARKTGVEAPLWMTLGFSDGETLYAVRYATDGDAPTLFHSREMDDLYRINPSLSRVFARDARAVVSEPLGRPGRGLERDPAGDRAPGAFVRRRVPALHSKGSLIPDGAFPASQRGMGLSSESQSYTFATRSSELADDGDTVVSVGHDRDP